MSESQIVSEVSLANVRSHVEHITAEIPSRLAGSSNGRRMAEYSAESLRACGVDARVHDVPGLVSFPEKAGFRVLGPHELVVEANTLGHSAATLAEGLSAELIDVGAGDVAGYGGRSAVGKITLSELSYSPARHEKQRIAGLMGAAGCVMMNWGHDENEAVPFGSVKPAWGNPTPDTFKTEMATLPCIGIARTAGLRLREMLRAGPVRVWLRTNVENGWRPIQVTVGEIAGAGDDFVVVGGHQDSWPGPQATDNAAGTACLLELARLFGRRRAQLRRGLVFGCWTGHETGTMIGSAWFADQNWARLRAHAVAYLQIDQPACVGASEWTTHSNAELRRFHQGAEARQLGRRPIRWHRAVKNGDASFFGLGVPMLTGEASFTDAELKASALATLGWWHHSLENTIDKLDWESMAEHLRVYAAYLWELCTAVVLPYEFVTVADQFVERLAALDDAANPVRLDGVLASAQAFRRVAIRLEEVAATWRQRYARGETVDEGPAEVLNTCFKRLSRTLVPLASTVRGTYGHDPYGYTPQGTMIPSLFDLPNLAGMPDGEERWLLETRLTRDRNRVGDALVDGRLLVEQTIGQLA